MKIIINTPLVTLNEYINAERSNKMYAASIKKSQTDKVCFLASQKGCIKGDRIDPNGCYDINFTWFKPNNRIDHDNIDFAKKFVLDGVKKALIIKDDSPRYVRNFTNTFVLDKSRSYVSCIIEFVRVK